MSCAAQQLAELSLLQMRYSTGSVVLTAIVAKESQDAQSTVRGFRRGLRVNFCPSCGGGVDHTETVPDVATDHAYYVCRRCKMCWEETFTKDGEILHISPYKKEPLW